MSSSSPEARTASTATQEVPLVATAEATPAATPEIDTENQTIGAEIDVAAKKWIENQVKEEVQRLRKANVIIMPYNVNESHARYHGINAYRSQVLNCGVVPNFERRLPRVVNG